MWIPQKGNRKTARLSCGVLRRTNGMLSRGDPTKDPWQTVRRLGRGMPWYKKTSMESMDVKERMSMMLNSSTGNYGEVYGPRGLSCPLVHIHIALVSSPNSDGWSSFCPLRIPTNTIEYDISVPTLCIYHNKQVFSCLSHGNPPKNGSTAAQNSI